MKSIKGQMKPQGYTNDCVVLDGPSAMAAWERIEKRMRNREMVTLRELTDVEFPPEKPNYKIEGHEFIYCSGTTRICRNCGCIAHRCGCCSGGAIKYQRWHPRKRVWTEDGWTDAPPTCVAARIAAAATWLRGIPAGEGNPMGGVGDFFDPRSA